MSPRLSRRILFVAHAFPPESCAGVEIYTLRLARELASRGHEVAVLTARVRAGQPQNHLIEEDVEGLRVWGVVQNYPYRDLPEALRDPAVDRVVGGLLDRFEPELLAVQSLAGLSLGILDEAGRRNIPRVVHLHDAWWSCPSGGQRRRPDGGLCAPVCRELCGACFELYRHREGPLERASRWLAARLPGPIPPDTLHRGFNRLPDGAREGLRKINERAARRGRGPIQDEPSEALDPRIENRHADVVEALASVERCLSPTDFLLSSLGDDGLQFGDSAVVRTGVPVDAPPTPRSSEGPLRVLFAGTWVEHKGPHVLAEALADSGLDVEARAAGPAPFPAYREAVLERASGQLTSIGTLAPEQVRAQMDWADVVVVPSLWAENAPLVVLEAQAAGRPVIASDIGGLPELVREGIDGHLFPPGDSAALRQLLGDTPGIRRLKVRPPRDLGSFVDEVMHHYEEVLA